MVATKKTKKRKQTPSRTSRRKQKYMTKRIRKINRIGGYSYAITLPMDAIKSFKWKEGQRLELEVDFKKERILVKDYKP